MLPTLASIQAHDCNQPTISYFFTNRTKDTYLKPPASVSGPSLLALGDARAGKKLYICEESVVNYVSGDPSTLCPDCDNVMTADVEYVAAEDGGLVKDVVTYMVMDDLEVKPMSAVSSLALLNTLKVKDVGGLEEKVVSLGMNEAVKLLKSSLHSNKVLTDVFL